MEFTIKRKELVEATKSMKAVVPRSSPIKELECFLLDSDEDTGEIILTATNMESSIQRKLKASVGVGGTCAVDARMLTDMAALLGKDDVNFKMLDNGWLAINSGNCTYTVSTLFSSNYPRPEMPFPEDTMKVTGLCDLYARTSATVGSDIHKPALMGIHLDIYSDCIRAVACDGMRLALTKRSSETGGKLSVTIPKTSLQHLAQAVNNNDVLEVGECGNFLVFMKKGLLFSTRLLVDKYIDTDQLLGYIESAYIAKTDSNKLADAVDTICVVAGMDSDYNSKKMNMRFGDGEISFAIKNDSGASSSSVPAVISKQTPNSGFWYNPIQFADSFRTVCGEVEVHVSEKGFIIFKNSESQYMMSPTQPPKAKAEKKPKAKAA